MVDATELLDQLRVTHDRDTQVPLLCSFALGRGQYCTEPHRHTPDHF